jgi:CubicO group peptidase (beta-lactamase class C family)
MKKFMLISLLLLKAISIGSLNGSEDLEKKIDALFAPSDNPDIPGGFAVALVKDGQVLFKKAYGCANNEYDIPFSAKSVFDFASIAKQFTGLSIAILIELGKLSLEDNIMRYLPELPVCCRKIKIRHLLDHSSGLRDCVGLVKLSGRYSRDVITADFLMKLVLNQRELNFVPGDQYRYSNTGYFLLARIVSRVTKK